MILNPHRWHLRLHLVGFCIFGGLLILAVNLFRLQVGKGQSFSQKVRQQSTLTILLPPARGLVTDRWGIPLAELRPSIDVDLYLPEIVSFYKKKHRLKNAPTVVNQVMEHGLMQAKTETDIITITKDAIAPLQKLLGDRLTFDEKALILHQRIRPKVPFQLKSDLTFQEISILMERNLAVPGIAISPRPVRMYPYGATASHILGYVGRPEQAIEIQHYGGKIELETIGKDGIEYALDEYLQGRPGFRNVEVDALGNVQKMLAREFPKLGGTVYLTIDLRVQQIVEKIMAGVGRGACVVADPNNGDILAMVSVPNYDPNVIGNKTVWQDVSWNPTRPLYNRALASYAPGSIFKTVVALAALKHNEITPNFTTTCSGGIMVADRFRKCWGFDRGIFCGTQNLVGALKRSCNVFFYTVGIKTGIEKVHEVANMLGLGKTSGLPLKGESAGVIPSLEWMKKNYPRDRWSSGHMANMAIGQGFVAVTPLQMAEVIATIANRGTCYEPRLISRIVNSSNLVVREDPPKVRAVLDIPPDKIELVREGLKQVVNEPGGTGSGARVPEFVVAGKTGSAQFPTRINGRSVKDTRTWFISFAPYDKPAYAICMMVEGGESGGKTVAPLVRQVYEQLSELIRANGSYQLTYLQPYRGHFQGVQEISTPVVPGLPVPHSVVPTPVSPDTQESPNPMPEEEVITPQLPADGALELQENEMPPDIEADPNVKVKGGRSF